MSALGQRQTSEHDWIMSALPPKADIADCYRHVRFVPKADIAGADEEKKISLRGKTRIFRAGHRELKCGTPRHVCVRPQVTAMCLNDSTADR